jgi:Icc-related predicted phosphoesterase
MKRKVRIWAISDTHARHGYLRIPSNIDVVIHAGDESNAKAPAINYNECLNFLEWYKNLYIKHKVFVAGNHSTAIGSGLIRREDIPKEIIYLQHESAVVDGLNIFGSPYTPTFGHDWAFNVPRHMLGEYWNDIPRNTDILVTHGPPKGVLDLTMYDSRDGAEGNSYFQCGCKPLFEKVKLLHPKYHIFGHIHPEKECHNAGVLKIQNLKTTFMNAAVVNLDYVLNNHGHVFEIEMNK